MNKHYILISILTISALHAADYNQLTAPNISRQMSLKTLNNLDAQADCIQLKARIAFRERKEELLRLPASEVTLEELEIIERLLTYEQYSKTKKNERICCAAVAAIGVGGLLACEALNENIPSIHIFNTEGVFSIDLDRSCLTIGVATAVIGIIEFAKIIMQPTMKHKIEELQEVIQEKRKEKSE